MACKWLTTTEEWSQVWNVFALRQTFVGHVGYVSTSSLCHVTSCFCQIVLEGLNQDWTGGHFAILIRIWKASSVESVPALFFLDELIMDLEQGWLNGMGWGMDISWLVLQNVKSMHQDTLWSSLVLEWRCEHCKSTFVFKPHSVLTT